MFELSATIAQCIALLSQIMIYYEQFYSGDDNAMILQKSHCRREQNIVRVSVALAKLFPITKNLKALIYGLKYN